MTQGPNVRSPGTKYNRSKIVFAVTSIALTLVPLGTKLLEIPAQFLIGSPGTLAGRRWEGVKDGNEWVLLLLISLLYYCIFFVFWFFSFFYVSFLLE